jgi:hypothetical protein
MNPATHYAAGYREVAACARAGRLARTSKLLKDVTCPRCTASDVFQRALRMSLQRERAGKSVDRPLEVLGDRNSEPRVVIVGRDEARSLDLALLLGLATRAPR